MEEQKKTESTELRTDEHNNQFEPSFLENQPSQNDGQNTQAEEATFLDDFLAWAWETVKIVAVSLAIIVPIRYYLIQPFFVKGQSMEPNFHDKDYVLVDKLGYRFHSPQRGDVIIFRYPVDPSEYFIKRIIGLPGETVQLKDGNIVIYNTENPQGLVLQEKEYLPNYQKSNNESTLKLDPNEYYVMGDNRSHSSDSRVWGALNKSFISGRAWLRLFPFDSISSIPRQDYPGLKQTTDPSPSPTSQ